MATETPGRVNGQGRDFGINSSTRNNPSPDKTQAPAKHAPPPRRVYIELVHYSQRGAIYAARLDSPSGEVLVTGSTEPLLSAADTIYNWSGTIKLGAWLDGIAARLNSREARR